MDDESGCAPLGHCYSFCYRDLYNTSTSSPNTTILSCCPPSCQQACFCEIIAGQTLLSQNNYQQLQNQLLNQKLCCHYDCKNQKIMTQLVASTADQIIPPFNS